MRVLLFGVEDSLDVTAYQRLKTKGAIADSIMNGKKMREELEEKEKKYAEMDKEVETSKDVNDASEDENLQRRKIWLLQEAEYSC